jgi:hypothetical protein
MSVAHAALGVYPKKDKRNKVYYVNRNNHGFSVRKTGEDGKPIPRVNLATGLPIMNGRGEPEFIEEAVMFQQWHSKFQELGYWCVYEVTKETPKIIADELERMANIKTSQIMSEKAFIEFSNPALAQHMAETAEMQKEKERLADDIANAKNEMRAAKEEKNKLEDEIARLKQKAGIK